MLKSKRLLLALGIVFVVLLGLYYVVWKRQADNYLAMAQTEISQLNGAPIAEGITLKVDQSGMSVGGFPFKHALIIQNPVFHVEYSFGALKAIGMQMTMKTMAPPSPNAAPAPTLPIQPGDGTLIDTDYKLNGEMTLAIHYFTTHVDLKTKGEVSGTTTASGFSLPFKSDGGTQSDCNLSFRFGSLGMFLGSMTHHQPVTAKDLEYYLKGASCHISPQKIVAGDNGEPLYSSGDYLIDAAKIHFDPAAMRLRAHIKIKDYEIFDRSARFSAALVLNQKPDEVKLMPFQQHDVIGKTNLDLDISLLSENATSFFTQGLQSTGHLRIDAETADFSNNVMKVSAPVLLEFRSGGDIASFTARHHGSFTFNAAFDTAMEQSMHQNLEDKATRDTLAAQFGAADKADTLSSYISDVLPKVSGFGTIRTDIDLYGNYSETNPPKAGVGNINAKEIRFSSDPYGLSLTGNFDAATKIGLLTLDCVHCPQLIADAVEYNNRIQKTMTAIQPQHDDFNISPEFYQTIVSFLGDLNTSKDKDTIDLNVVSDGKGSFTVSGKPFLQVMLSAMQTFGPLVSKEKTAPIAPADPEP